MATSGTSYADNLTNTSSNVKVSGLGGNDTITNSGDSVTIDGGDGYDRIISSGSNVSINGGADNDTISLTGGGGNIIQASSGYDYVYGFKATDTVKIGNGNDTFVKQTSGNNVIIKHGKGNVWLYNAASLSAVNVSGKEVPPVTLDNRENSTLLAGEANNDVLINSGDSVTIDAGDGNDSITSSGTKGSIYSGAGNDTIRLTGNGGNLIHYSLGSDVIYGFKATDTLKLRDGDSGYQKSVSGGDVILFVSGGGNVTLKSAASLSSLNIAGRESFNISNTANSTLIKAGDGHDTIWNGDYDQNVGNYVTIDGGDGNDHIHNRSGNNVSINGGKGNDTLDNYGNAGSNVTIIGGEGDDYINNDYRGRNVKIDGGAGNDSVWNNGSNVSINLGAGNDSITNDGSDVTIDGGDDNDTVDNRYGSNVSINGGKGNDSIANSGSDLTIDGGDGDDTVENNRNNGNYSSDNYGKNVIIRGGKGNDSISNRASDVTIDGGDDNDTITNGYSSYISDVSINGGAGDDSIWNSAIFVTTHGGAGNDWIWNDNIARNSKIDGGDGDDEIINDAAQVTVLGGKGNDTIENGGFTWHYGGDIASVSVDGGEGNDLIRNNGDHTTINGGDGDDTIDNSVSDSYGNHNSGVFGYYVSISGGKGNDSIRNGAKENVTIDTGEGNDTIKVGNTSVTNFAVENFGAGDVIELYRSVNSIEIVGGSLVAGDLTIAGISAVTGESDTWEIDGTSATFTRKKSAGGAKLSEDGKIITFEAGTGSGTSEELFVISGLKKNVTASELGANVTISGSTVTVGKNILGEDDVEISDGFTLALADDVPTSEDIAANWSVNGSTVTYTGDYVTEGYALDGNKIIYRDVTKPETFTLTGVKKNLTKSVLNANVTIDGAQVTLNENVLGEGNVTISDDWTLALADSVPKSETVPANWDLSSAGETTTAIYTAGGSTSGYALVDNKIIYAGAAGGNFTLTGLSKKFTSDYVSIEYKKIILSAKALAETNVALTTDDGFTLALGEDCPTVTAVEKSWKLSGTTAKLQEAGKSGGYKLTNSKSVTYTAPVEGKTLLTVKGLTDGLEVVDGAIDGLSVNGKTLTVTPDVVGENLSISSGYKIVFDAGEYAGSKFTGTTGKDTIEVNGSGLEIEGGKGNDTITSKNGGNVYLFSATGGKDVIVGYGDDDTIKITDDSKVTASVKGSDVIIKVGTATMTLKNAATGTQVNVVDSSDETLIDEIFYADRIVKDNGATLTAAFNSKSFAADETIRAVDGSASAKKFSLTGGDEDNTLIGGTGANFLNGGEGDNILTGGKGNDTFVAGNGNDTITDYGVGTDKISLAADVEDFKVEGSDVILSFGEDKTLTIQNGVDKKINFLKNGKTSTEIFTSGGKTNTNQTSITLAASTENYTAPKAMLTIDGGLTDDVWIVGNAKSNKILGGDGNDTLFGGTKNDTLTGGNGADIFIFETGRDVITDYVSGEDTISLAASPTSETLNSKGDVILKFGTNSLTIKNVGGQAITFADDTTKIYYSERIVGEDGVTLQSTFGNATFAATDELPKVDGSASAKKFTLTGGDESNTLIGGKGVNLLNGGKGNDLLIGGGGSDTFVYSSGDDTIGDFETKDRISLTSAVKDFSLENDDVIISFDEGSLTIKDAAGKSITFLETVNGKITTQVNVFAKDGIFNTAKTAATLAADTSTFNAAGYSKLVTIDGGLATDAISIVGNGKDNKILAGDNGSTLDGGKGNDSLWGGDGSDTFIHESGKDVIYGFGNEDALQLGNFTASVKDNSISFNVGNQPDAVILKDYSATSFNINGNTYTIDTLTKK